MLIPEFDLESGRFGTAGTDQIDWIPWGEIYLK
jgi:hypothetical protein